MGFSDGIVNTEQRSKLTATFLSNKSSLLLLAMIHAVQYPLQKLMLMKSALSLSLLLNSLGDPSVLFILNTPF